MPIFIIEGSAHWSREKVICAKMFLKNFSSAIVLTSDQIQNEKNLYLEIFTFYSFVNDTLL